MEVKGIINKSGVYCLKFDGVVMYVGSSASNLESRKSNHLAKFRKGIHTKNLQPLWDKYGEENFEFEVLVFCDAKDTLRQEQYYMEWYQNTIKNYSNVKSFKPRKRSEEQKEHSKKINEGVNNKNNKYSLEEIVRIKKMLNRGFTYKYISKVTNIDTSYISQIKNNYKWESVDINKSGILLNNLIKQKIGGIRC